MVCYQCLEKDNEHKSMKNDIVFESKKCGGLLDVVRSELCGIPRGKLKSYLEHGLIYVDGHKTTRFDFPVKPGQTVKIALAQKSAPKSPLKVLYEDDFLLAVDKPAGLLTVATDTEKEKTALRLLRDSGISPVYVVHRLDRDTSGVLLFAKSAELRDKLQSSWDSGITREYLAVCEGVFEKKAGRCDTLLAETRSHLVYSSKTGQGKRAVTNYEVIKENGNYSLLRVIIETGRKNQIRVHLSELGHPVAGDKKYGAHGSPLKRLGLHASLLGLKHPVTGEMLVISSPADEKFRLPQ